MGTRCGARNCALHILMSRANMYGLTEEQAKIEVKELFDYFNAIYPHDKKTESELNKAYKGYMVKYNNKKILEKTGIDVSIENKREIKRNENKSKRIKNLSSVDIISIELVKEHGIISYDKLAELLKSNGIKTSATSLKRNENIKNLLKSVSKVHVLDEP